MTEEKKVSTEIKVIDVRDDVQRFNAYDEKIKALEVYRELKIDGIEDKEGAKAVRAARIECKNIMTAIEKDRKVIGAPVLELTKSINAKAKEFSDSALEVRELMEAEEKTIADELAKIRAKEEAEKEAKINERIDLINSLGVVYSGFSYTIGDTFILMLEINEFSDEDFTLRYSQMFAENTAICKAEAERKRLEQVESDRLAKEKAEQEAKQAEIDKQLAELAEIKAEQARKADELKAEELRIKQVKQAAKDAEKAKADAEKQRITDAKKAEADKVKAVEDARIKERERLEKEAEQVKEKAEAAKRIVENDARLAPDKEKLKALAFTVKTLELPIMKTKEGNEATVKARDQFDKMAAWLTSVAEKL